MTDNVVLFPKGKKGAPPMSKEELLNNVREAREEHVDFIVDQILDIILQITDSEGFSLYGEENLNNITLLTESIKSAMLYTVGVEHFLQDLADDLLCDDILEQVSEAEDTSEG